MNRIKRWAFIKLWANNRGPCKTCGAPEGHCEPETCIRLRITDRLNLVSWSRP